VLPIVIKQKVAAEALQWSGERKCKGRPVKPNWKANWTYTMQLLCPCWTTVWHFGSKYNWLGENR